MSSRTTTSLAALGAAAAGCLAWGAGVEVGSYRLRRASAPVLRPGQAPMTVLHLSDLHLTPARRREVAWVRALADLEPDLVVDTGDNLASAAAVPVALEALEPLLARPGAFVLGSNDYFGPRPANPAQYLLGPSRQDRRREPLPTGDLVAALSAAGWADLTNARARLSVAGRRVDLVGVDDPHLGLDRYLDVAGPADPDADLTVGVAHAPYRRVLDAMTADGCDLLLAGHTHGGQLCVPGFGALVTNCDLPRSHAKGLHRWQRGRASTWLHVSAGLGTSPYARVRFACPPEATLLTLVART
ncbi:Predicted phosphohydrolase, MPP superfamily [Quadrisphaera sp. DSM 44207]|nr:metallophosphoesterase [Quadrisphaera sp. DSM 44207]SDQ18146.1 Predicted phosphohydrolase, MPP superfamily [Quadrisphaera sp. DSM 44207]